MQQHHHSANRFYLPHQENGDEATCNLERYKQDFWNRSWMWRDTSMILRHETAEAKFSKNVMKLLKPNSEKNKCFK